MLSRIALVGAVLLLAVGCGGAGSVDGKVAGNELRVEDAAFVAGKDTSGRIVASVLVMADVPDICGKLQANRQPKNATSMTFVLFRSEGSGWDTAFLSPEKGTYTVVDLQSPPPPNFALAGFVRSDANCTNVIDPARSEAKSGTITVDKIEFKADGLMTGKFDVTFGSQKDNVKGTFNASFCDALLSDSTPNCE